MQTEREILADIKREMSIQDINMKELAIGIGVKQQNISQIFKTANPKLSTLLKICGYLHLRISLIKGDTK